MTTTTSNIARPDWADPTLDLVDDDNQHPEDNLTWVNSQPVDEWTAVVHEGVDRTFTGSEPVRVALSGLRHHAGPEVDFSQDQITVTGDLMPGDDGMFGLRLTAENARRLAAALTAAADLLEGNAAKGVQL